MRACVWAGALYDCDVCVLVCFLTPALVSPLRENRSYIVQDGPWVAAFGDVQVHHVMPSELPWAHWFQEADPNESDEESTDVGDDPSPSLVADPDQSDAESSGVDHPSPSPVVDETVQTTTTTGGVWVRDFVGEGFA
jgi:hypothetical protein